MRTILIVFACAISSISQPVYSQVKDLLSPKINAYIQPYVDTKNFSGTVLVARKGRILYLQAFGLADETLHDADRTDTKYHIASLSKSFTAAAILLLQERNLLHVTDPLSTFIPDYPHGDKITIHQLLTHTSGIPNINDMPEYDTILRFPQTTASLVAVFKNKALDFAPGTKYSYSNSNYNLLAYIIEKVSGKDYGAFVSENILAPLRMTNTGHDADPHRIINNMAVGYQPDQNFGIEKADYVDWTAKTGNGSLYSTAEDLYKWDRALYTEKILSRGSLDKMFTDYTAGTGYGWSIDNHLVPKRIYFNGRSPGFSSYIGRYIDADVCIIVLSNNYIPLPTKIGTDIAAILFNGKCQLPTIYNGKTSPLQALEIVGKYQFDSSFYRPGMLMTIREKDGRLYSDWGELIPEDPMHYIDRVYWLEVSFVKDSAGKVSMLDYGSYKGIRKE